MKEKILENASNLLDETIANIQTMVKINSVRDEKHAIEHKPFGPGIDQAFDKFLDLCNSIGMRTYKDVEGKYAYAEIGPEDAQLIGILGHLDVVPVGDESLWTQAKPFSGDVVDDKIIGRGSLDDKGPVVVSLMAIKNLLDLGYKFKSRIRIIVGGAEETTWEGIDRYIELEEKPVVSFSPDAEFPLINAEKSLCQFDASAQNNYDFEVEALGAYNAVNEKATYRGSHIDCLIEKLDELNFEYVKNDDSISVIGKTAHSKDCDKAINAITRLAKAMYLCQIHSTTTDFLATQIDVTTNGEIICGKSIEDEVSGKLTLNVANLEIKDGHEKIGFDARIPVTFNEDEIINQFQNAVENAGMKFSLVDLLRKLYVAEDSPLVTTLMNVYKEVTKKDDAKPLSSGGATYSRVWENCVAYGMLFEDDGMLDLMHQPNECLEIKYIIPALQIYSLAVYELDQLKF